MTGCLPSLCLRFRPCDPDALAELFVFLKCPVPQSLGLDIQDEPPMLSTPHL